MSCPLKWPTGQEACLHQQCYSRVGVDCAMLAVVAAARISAGMWMFPFPIILRTTTVSAVSPWLECYELQWSLYYPCIGTHWISYTCIYILMSCKSHIFHSTWFINTLLWYRSLGVMWDFPGVGQLNTHPTWRTIFCFPAWPLYMGKGTSHPRCQLRKKKQKNSRIDVKGPNQTGPWHRIPLHPVVSQRGQIHQKFRMAI